MNSLTLFCRIYRVMLYGYPAAFRRRYGNEMAQIFADRCRHATQSHAIVGFLLLITVDWLRSVTHERMLLLEPATNAAPAYTWPTDGVPAFYLCGNDAPARKALIQGGVLSLLVFAALTFALTHWGNHRMTFWIGAARPFSGLLQVDERSAFEPERTTKVKIGADSEELWNRFVASYFREILVLLVLDKNYDLVISADEIAAAPSRLRLLDVNGDGKLDAVECGLVLFRQPPPDAEWPKEAAREFMRFHPVLAALDTNHDGEISADEISNSAAALKKLVRKKDGTLNADELVPYRR